jgi:DNA-directed RNA polymerase subunit RPC12/RpoP
MAWAMGMKCPKCGSDQLAPAPIIEGALDYSIADRSKGYAIEDIRFGKIAQWAGFISPFQYNQALAKQKQTADAGTPAPHIAQVLISQKIMSELQMKAVLEVYETPRPDAGDREFVKVAAQNKFITAQQGDEMLELQRAMKREGSTPPPVSALIFEKKLMKENQIIAILRAQHKRMVGPIHEALATVERHRPPTVIEKYIGKKGDPLRKYRAAAYVTAGIVLALFWAWYQGLIKFRREKIPYYCTNCKEAFIAPAGSTVPVKCPYCKQTSAYYGYYCEKCRRAYGLPHRKEAGKIQCTHCKSMLFSELTPEKIEEAKQRTREEQEADQRGVRKADFKVE